MTYPSQPGYPSPQYGGPPQSPQNQNNLWLVGGAIVVVLVIIMTVILLVVQRTASSDSTDGGDGGDGGDTVTDTDHSNLQPAELVAEACEELDFTAIEEALGENIDPSSASNSSSSTDSYDSVACYSYTETSYNSVSGTVYDYETADDPQTYIEWDAESYSNDPDYEFAEYTDYGDAGSVYTNISDPSYQTTYLHVALGSLEVSLSAGYDGNEVDSAAVAEGLGDLLKQFDVLFAEYK
jgi:hypothetical protein